MRGRYFRYLFENLDDGLFHSGSIYDKEEKKTTNYIYMVGSYCRDIQQKIGQDSALGFDTIPEAIDLLVVGAYTGSYTKKLVGIVKTHRIKTIILPYLAPIQRLILVDRIRDNSDLGKAAIRFLQDPYLFLKECGIEQIYFLYGNGEKIGETPEELPTGCHFEAADEEVQRLVYEMEGYEVPLVQAGYLIENRWLFYFGVYGIDIKVLSAFTREYFSHIENIQEIATAKTEECVVLMKHLIVEYLKRFGRFPATTIAMFEGPLYAHYSENECFLTEKEFSRKERCEAWIKYQGDSQCTCAIRCMHNKDYDTLHHFKNKITEEARLGILMLGNANLNRYLPAIEERFWGIKMRIRGISVPNCGSVEDWGYQILDFPASEGRTYWLCSKHEITSTGVVSEIVLSASKNRFLTIDEARGCCLSGYLIPKEDMD